MTTENRGTYWTFTIISILAAGVLGYVAGYGMKSQQTQPSVTVNEQPDVEADIFNQLITEANTVTVGENTEVSSESAQIYTFFGYVRSLTENEIVLENPEVVINGSSKYTFTLEETTEYFEVDSVLVNNQPDYKTTTLTAENIQVGDIVSIYTPEDIRTADVRFAASVERISESPEGIETQ